MSDSSEWRFCQHCGVQIEPDRENGQVCERCEKANDWSEPSMKPDRDPVTCAVCDDEATTSTPEGGMCDEHARELAEDLR